LVVAAGASRQQIARTLNAAYADGLLSEDTFCRRLDQLLDARLVDPFRLIGDLNLRTTGVSWRSTLVNAVVETVRRVRSPASGSLVLLALDWSGSQSELLLGRHPACEIVLSDLRVSRRHARLRFRDGSWVLQDLESTNGTTVNGVRVGRCELRPGDVVTLGSERLQID
jgi:hypothetical protein